MKTKSKQWLRDVYRNIPLKRPFFFLIKRVYLPKQPLYQHLWFNGEFTVRVGDSFIRMVNYDSHLETSLFWDGIAGYEKHSVHLWSELCKKSSVIFDVGANTIPCWQRL